MDGATDAAESHYTLFHTEPDDAPVLGAKPASGSQLALFANYSGPAFITDRRGDTR